MDASPATPPTALTPPPKDGPRVGLLWTAVGAGVTSGALFGLSHWSESDYKDKLDTDADTLNRARNRTHALTIAAGVTLTLGAGAGAGAFLTGG